MEAKLRDWHHANLLVGSPEGAESFLRSLCETVGIELANNPDFFVFKTETFGIDEAREVKLLSARRAVTPRQESGQASRKIFLIAPARLTLEAQNALLKTFEDPLADTFFFLVVREEGLVIPTLCSRMQTIRVQSVQGLALYPEAEKFLSSSIKDRLLFAKSFVDEKKNPAVFLDDLLSLLRKQEGQERMVKSVYNVRRFAGDSAVLPRLVIEHLALVL